MANKRRVSDWGVLGEGGTSPEMDAVGEPRGGWPSSEMESSGAAGGGSHAPTLPPSPGAKWTPERRRGGSVAPIKRSVLLPFHPSRPQTSLRWGEPVAAQQAAGWPSAAGGSSPWCTCSAASLQRLASGTAGASADAPPIADSIRAAVAAAIARANALQGVIEE